MTEREMMEELDDIWTFGHEPTDRQREAVGMAMDALEKIQQYREIGTVEEIKRMQKYSAPARKHDTIGKVIGSCAEYEEIGTVEECREAAGKRKPVKPDEVSPCRTVSFYKRPVCGEILNIGKGFCCNCGQAVLWEGGDE